MTGTINESEESMGSLGPILFLHPIKGGDDNDSVSSLESMCSFADDEDDDDDSKTPGPRGSRTPLRSSGRRIRGRPLSSSSPNHACKQLRQVGALRRCGSANNAGEIACKQNCDEGGGVRRSAETNMSARVSRIQRCKGSFRLVKTTGSLRTCSSDDPSSLGGDSTLLDVESTASTHSRSVGTTRSQRRFSRVGLKITVADTSGLRRSQQPRLQSERQLSMPKKNRLRALSSLDPPRLPPRKATNDAVDNEDILRATRRETTDVEPFRHQSERQLATPKKNRLQALTNPGPPRLPPRKATNDAVAKEDILQAARRIAVSTS